MARTPEGIVKDDVKKLLKARGIAYYMHVPYGMGENGVSDFICCWQGRFLAIEAKAPGKRIKPGPTPNQIRFHKKMAAAGALTLVADDVSQVAAFLDAVTRGEEFTHAQEKVQQPTRRSRLQKGVRTRSEETYQVPRRPK